VSFEREMEQRRKRDRNVKRGKGGKIFLPAKSEPFAFFIPRNTVPIGVSRGIRKSEKVNFINSKEKSKQKIEAWGRGEDRKSEQRRQPYKKTSKVSI